MSDSLRSHGLQHASLPCPSPTPGAYSNSCPSSRWCHPIISSSVIPFSFCLLSFPASGSFPVSQFFTSGGQSIQVSASASVLTMNIQDWCLCLNKKWLHYSCFITYYYYFNQWLALIILYARHCFKNIICINFIVTRPYDISSSITSIFRCENWGTKWLIFTRLCSYWVVGKGFFNRPSGSVSPTPSFLRLWVFFLVQL